jgi:hypothetical protein
LFSCACVKFSGNDGEVFPDVHDGITNLFLRYPSQANKQGTFVHQAKYTKDLMKKFKMAELKPVYTLMSTSTSLDLDENGEAANQGVYKSMIGSILYLTVTRTDIQFTVCLCACFQASPRSSHRTAVQWIFRYLKHTLEFGIWYFASASLDLVSFSAVDFACCGIDRKRTSHTCYLYLILSCLLVFLKTIFNCPIHHRG